VSVPTKWKVLGVVLALLHLAASWYVILRLVPRSQPDAQWQLAWLPLVVLDFPFSMAAALVVRLLPNWQVSGLPYPMSDFRWYLAPAVFHGVIGPLWFALAPATIWKWSQAGRRREQAA
jgi:hypothetical protein